MSTNHSFCMGVSNFSCQLHFFKSNCKISELSFYLMALSNTREDYTYNNTTPENQQHININIKIMGYKIYSMVHKVQRSVLYFSLPI